MAKKNSTKTATKEALQASEPRILSFKSWTGINIAEAPLGWEPAEKDAHAQSDLGNKFLTVQNNLETTDQTAVETRKDDLLVASLPQPGIEFTGVTCVHHHWLLCAFNDHTIRYHDLLNPSNESNHATSWTVVRGTENCSFDWTEIMPYDGALVCLNKQNHICRGDIKSGDSDNYHLEHKSLAIKAAVKLSNPSVAPTVTPKGDLVGRTFDTFEELSDWLEQQQDIDVNVSPQLVSIAYCYTNEFGSTLVSPSSEKYFAYAPVLWNGGRYVTISGSAPADAKGVDIYFSTDDSATKTICGHVDLSASSRQWRFNFTGAMLDVSQWSMSSVRTPVSNTTEGASAKYCTHINGRVYFWGDNAHPERVHIGGNPGHEFSLAIGTGGAFIDIKPGNGNVVNGVCRYKTASGSNIVTVLCGNKNTNSVRRYNIIETNVTATNELQSKTYEFEEVSNVVGCNSRHGYAVFEDGLYCLSRWGLGVTTMAMEYNNQMRTAYTSDAIDPVFKDEISVDIQNAHMCCMDGTVYFSMGKKVKDSMQAPPLEPVVFCYKVSAKAWYTHTIAFKNDKREYPDLLHLFPLDSDDSVEGVGYVCRDRVCVIPLTGVTPEQPPRAFDCTFMTPELASRFPVSQTHYLCQLEIRFDYLVTPKDKDLEVYVEGVDYYGRHFRVDKNVNTEGKVVRQLPVWIRIDKLVETYRIVVKGRARFRLTHILEKMYAQSSKVNLVYGFDDRIGYKDAHGHEGLDHHYLESYNNYREMIVT